MKLRNKKKKSYGLKTMDTYNGKKKKRQNQHKCIFIINQFNL